MGKFITTQTTPNNDRVLAIDPSVRALGWAVFRGAQLGPHGVTRHRHTAEAWVSGCFAMRRAVQLLCRQHGCGTVVLEMPQQFGGERGSTARETEAIQKLYFLVGMIGSDVMTRAKLVLVRPSSWKGNVGKAITQKRVRLRYGVAGDHNMVDAVGIGHWWVCKRLQSFQKG